jgi:hypothetical protein
MVKCADCGFLSIRNRTTHELCEVSEPVRGSGHPHLGIYENIPVCFVMAIPISEEMDGIEGTDSRSIRRFTEIVSKDRPCDKSVRWHQGFSPKEHRQMQFEEAMLRIQEERRDRDLRWQEEQRTRDQAHEDRIRADERAWQESQRRKDRREARISTWTSAGFGVLAALLGAVVGSLLTSHLSDQSKKSVHPEAELNTPAAVSPNSNP